MVKVLITGGCGFIGSNLVEYLLSETEWEIVILDNYAGGKREDVERVDGFCDRVSFVEGDIRKREDVAKAMAGCDYVVNLAAQAGVMPSIEDPFYDADINITGLLTVLMEAKERGVKRLVHASSAAPLGDQEMPMHEKKVPQPLCPYGASKLAGEAYCSAFAASFGLPSTLLRFSNVYGPKSYKKGSVVALFLKQIMKGETITVYGDGEQTRDFIHVRDICTAIHLSLEKELSEKFNLFQIATGEETSVNQLIAYLKEGLAGKVEMKEPNYVPPRDGEVIRNYADISKARKMLGFEPHYRLEEGLKDTIAWFLQHMK